MFLKRMQKKKRNTALSYDFTPGKALPLCTWWWPVLWTTWRFRVRLKGQSLGPAGPHSQIKGVTSGCLASGAGRG